MIDDEDVGDSEDVQRATHDGREFVYKIISTFVVGNVRATLAKDYEASLSLLESLSSFVSPHLGTKDRDELDQLLVSVRTSLRNYLMYNSRGAVFQQLRSQNLESFRKSFRDCERHIYQSMENVGMWLPKGRGEESYSDNDLSSLLGG